jgi:hypothetical protein
MKERERPCVSELKRVKVKGMSTKTCLSQGNVCVSLEVMPTFQMSSVLLLTTSPQGTTKTPRRADLPFRYRILRCRACKPLCDPHAKAKSPQVDPFQRSMSVTSQCQQGVCSRTCMSGCYTVSKRRAAETCGASKHPRPKARLPFVVFWLGGPV